MERLFKRLKRLWRRRQLDRDLEDELQFHLDMLEQEHPQARRQFGNITAWKEACRDLWALGAIETLWQDIRFAVRTLTKSPGFTIVAIAALALGIGANATVFTIVNGILLKNLPFRDSERIVYLRQAGVSYADFLALRGQAASFDGMGATAPTPCNLSDQAGSPQHYQCPLMSANAFSVLGLEPVIGRAFQAEDERPGAPPVALLAYSVWESRYGKDPGVIGKTVRLDSVPASVIGVMPRGIRFPTESDLWRPLLQGANPAIGRDSLMIFARLRSGASRSSAQAEVNTLAPRLERESSGIDRNRRFRLESFNAIAIPRKMIPAFYLLLGAVAFVLLIACANVANLMLGRAVTRAREIAIRAALGAGRWRVVRQLLAESLLLSFAGGGLGWLMAIWGARAFDAAVIPTGKPAWIDFSADSRVLVYLTAVSIASAILFGLYPALRLTRLDLNSVIKDGGRSAGVGVRSRMMSSVLVIGEMTLAVVLLTGAGLMIRSFLHAYAAPKGVDASKVLTMQIALPAQRYEHVRDRWAFWQRLQTKLIALPGVEAAAISESLPGSSRQTDFVAEGAAEQSAGRPRSSDSTRIGPDYFRALGVTLGRGREFSPDDALGGATVVVSEAFAVRVWPGEDAIGKRLRTIQSGVAQPWMTVVGVAPDILQESPDPSRHYPVIYQSLGPARQFDEFSVTARTRVPPATLGDAFRRAVQEIDEDQPVGNLETLEHVLDGRSWGTRVFGAMFTIFAGIAFALASVGLYAVIAQSVSQRTQEIGVRMAMGASGPRLLRMVFAQGMRQLGIGLALGLSAAWAVARVMDHLLVGVSPHDPVTFAGVAVALVVAGLAGCAIPAYRAIRVDPVVTLRCD